MGTLSKGYYSIFTGSENAKNLSKILKYYPGSALVLDNTFVDNEDSSKLVWKWLIVYWLDCHWSQRRIICVC